VFCTTCGAPITAMERFCAYCGSSLPAYSLRPAGPITAVKGFWRRMTDGLALNELWNQFQSEARTGYRLYSEEVDWKRGPAEPRPKRFLRVAGALFWAMAMKLSPPRRILLLLALAMLLLPTLDFTWDHRHAATPNLAFPGGVALLAVLAVELADRVVMKRDLEIAREIQSWLMPAAAPSVPGLDIAFVTRAANTVAGDYYDVFYRPLPGDRGPDTGGSDGTGKQPLIVIVADVAGKSVPAALLMATLQASLRSLIGLSPTILELIQRLNRYVCAQNIGHQRFTTAFLGEWRPDTGALEYVNAGHNWPVLRRSCGDVERLQTGGLPLGIKPDAEYECGQTVLAPGDALLIFTDGLVEAENSKEEEFGEGRLFQCLQSCWQMSSAEALRCLVRTVDLFAGDAPQHDDITCLIAKNVGP